jgi:hypothetical protein
VAQAKQRQAEYLPQLSTTVIRLVVNQQSQCFLLQVLLKRKEKPHTPLVKKSVMGLMFMVIVLGLTGTTTGNQPIGVFIEVGFGSMAQLHYAPDGFQFRLDAIITKLKTGLLLELELVAVLVKAAYGPIQTKPLT